MAVEKVIEAVFYKSSSGNEPVREWLLGLSGDDRKTVGYDLKTVELRWPLGMPLVKKMDKGLWEARSKLTDKKISRVFFTVAGGKMVLLHAIIKKSQETPKADLDIAKKRRDKVKDGG